jgi:hypothetical protein
MRCFQQLNSSKKITFFKFLIEMPSGKCLGSLSTATLASVGVTGEATASISTLWKNQI